MTDNNLQEENKDKHYCSELEILNNIKKRYQLDHQDICFDIYNKKKEQTSKILLKQEELDFFRTFVSNPIINAKIFVIKKTKERINKTESEVNKEILKEKLEEIIASLSNDDKEIIEELELLEFELYNLVLEADEIESQHQNENKIFIKKEQLVQNEIDEENIKIFEKNFNIK